MNRPRLAVGAGIATLVIAGAALIPTMTFAQTADSTETPAPAATADGGECAPGAGGLRLGGAGLRLAGPGGGEDLAEALGITVEELREASTAARESLADTYEERPTDEAEIEALHEAHRAALASALGITVEALEAAQETVREAHTASMIERIEEKVTDGTLTREQADELIESIESGERPAVPFPGHGRGPRGGFGGAFGGPLS